MTPAQRQLFQRPSRFEPVKRDELLWAELSPVGPFGLHTAPPQTAAQAAGLRYERKANGRLTAMYPLYGGAQWINFRMKNSSRLRWAQPDGMLLNFSTGLLTIIEIKIRHTESAWWSLRYLYEPLCEKLFPSWRIACCEMCRWFDPVVPWPEPYRRVAEPALLRAGEIGVHIWGA